MTDIKVGKSRPEACIVSEAPGRLSREAGLFIGTMDFDACTVLARMPGTANRGAVKVDVGGGKGAITLADPAFSDDVKLGTYRITIIEPASDAGTFTVEDPDGIEVGTGTVAVAFDGPVKFTIADATDFVAGDVATITVSDADSQVTVAEDGGNTGDGAVGSWTIDDGAVQGVYTLVCIEEVAAGGKFSVHNPYGDRLADLTVGVAYTDQINGTIADGSADWDLGDTITVTVNYDEDDDFYVPWNPAGTDGSEIAAAIGLYPVKQTSPVTTKAAVLVRAAEVHKAELYYEGTPTEAQKRLAYRQLAEFGIIARD